MPCRLDEDFAYLLLIVGFLEKGDVGILRPAQVPGTDIYHERVRDNCCGVQTVRDIAVNTKSSLVQE